MGEREGKQKQLDAIKDMLEDAFVILVPALGFQKYNLSLSIKGHMLGVFGRGVTPHGPRRKEM